MSCCDCGCGCLTVGREALSGKFVVISPRCAPSASVGFYGFLYWVTTEEQIALNLNNRYRKKSLKPMLANQGAKELVRKPERSYNDGTGVGDGNADDVGDPRMWSALNCS